MRDRPIIDYAMPPRPSRYPVREWILPLIIFLLPWLIAAVAFALVKLQG